MTGEPTSIAVVIPAYRVTKTLGDLLAKIGPEVESIIVVDDACPDGSGKIAEQVEDGRVEVIFHSENQGVGGAVKTGYLRALEIGSDIVIKIDGDGQMDPRQISKLIAPLREGRASYTKGNRFFEVETIRRMPKLRILGNLGLSFLSKLSTGYWHLFDPNNGFTAIRSDSLSRIPLHKVDSGYFFESDMLFRLYLSGAVVRDVMMPAIYGEETSHLRISRVFFEFPYKHLRNFWKRVAYSYYLKDFSLASVELPLGVGLGVAGVIRGVTAWGQSSATGEATVAGTVVLTAFLLLTSIQLMLAFLNFDMNNEPKS